MKCYRPKPMKAVSQECQWLTEPIRAFCVSWALCAPATATRVLVRSHTRVHPHTQRTCCCNMPLRYFLPFIQRALQGINQLSLSSLHTVILQTRNSGNSEIQTGGGFPHSVQIKGKQGKKTKLCLIYNARASSFLSYADDPSTKITISRNLEEETVVPVALT